MLPIWSFLAVTVPLVLTPGASTAVVLRNSISGGTRAGIETAVGVNSGSVCYGVLSAFGLALALRQWPSVWAVLRIGGMLYLGWLGLQSLWHAISPPRGGAATGRFTPSPRAGGSRSGAAQGGYEGFLTNLLNPAIASFYLVIVPQFVPRGAPVARSILMLTAVHVALAFSWHTVWAMAGGALARTLSGGWPRQILDVCTAAALLVLAAKMAF